MPLLPLTHPRTTEIKSLMAACRWYVLRDYHYFAQISRILVTTSTRRNRPLPLYAYVLKRRVLTTPPPLPDGVIYV